MKKHKVERQWDKIGKDSAYLALFKLESCRGTDKTLPGTFLFYSPIYLNLRCSPESFDIFLS